MLLAAVLRFATLRTQSIWFDEAATWDLVRQPFGEMLHRIPHGESNPPLFYVLEWVWTRIFGNGAFGLRSLSALAGTLTVPIAYALGRRVGGAARAGLATAALVAVSPLLVWFSQEARSYALAVFLSAAALLLFQRCVEDARSITRDWSTSDVLQSRVIDPRRSLAAWSVVAALALGTHYFTAFALIPQALWLLWRHPRRQAAWTAVGTLAAVGLALLPLLLAQRGNPYDIAGESLVVRLAQVPKQFLLGYRGPLALPLGVAGAALVAVGAWLLVRRTEPAVRRAALRIGAIGGIAVALPALVAALGIADYLNARNVLPALGPLLTALGVGYGVSRPAWHGLAALTGLCALSLALVVTVVADRSYQRPDWAGLAHALGDAATPRAIVISPANGELALRYYRPGLRTMGADGAVVREVDVVGIAGSTRPGETPTLPEQVGTALGVAGFGAPRRIATGGYEILNFRARTPVPVTPNPLGVLRFSQGYPSVDVLAAAH